MGKLADKVAKGVFWTLLEKSGVQFAHFLVTLVLARLLTPDDYGTVALLSVFISIANVLVDAGFASALIQRKNATQTDYNTVFYLSLASAAAMYAALFAAAPAVERFYGAPGLAAMLRALAVSVVFQSINGVQNVELTRKMLFHLSFRISLATTAAWAVSGVAFALAGLGAWALVWSSLLSGFCGVVARQFFIRWRPSLSFSWESAKSLFSFGWKMTAASLLTSAYNNLYALLIGKFYTKADLAFVKKGSHVPKVLMSATDEAIGRVSYAALVKLQDDPARMRRAMRRMISCSSFALFPALALLVLLADPLVRLLYGERWLGAAVFIRISCLALFSRPFDTINLKALTARGRSGTYLKLILFRRAVGLAIMATALRFGVVEFMLASAITYGLIGLLINTAPTWKHLGYSPLMQLRDVAPPILLSGAAAAAAFAVGFAPLPPKALVLPQLAVGFAVYAALAVAFKAGALSEFAAMLLPKLRKRSPPLARLAERLERRCAGRCAADERSESEGRFREAKPVGRASVRARCPQAAAGLTHSPNAPLIASRFVASSPKSLKREIRDAMRRERRTLPPARKSALDAAICEELALVRDAALRADPSLASSTVAVYLATKEEIDLSPFISNLLASGVRVAAPRWNGTDYDLAELKSLDRSALRTGPMGVLEPDAGAASVPPDAVRFWVVPGLAFTHDGRRLGYGGGWYDRLLSAAPPDAHRVAVAYPFQLVASLPSEPHDISMTRVVTGSQSHRDEASCLVASPVVAHRHGDEASCLVAAPVKARASRPRTLSEVFPIFLAHERGAGLFALEIDGLPFWHLVRFSVYTNAVLPHFVAMGAPHPDLVGNGRAVCPQTAERRVEGNAPYQTPGFPARLKSLLAKLADRLFWNPGLAVRKRRILFSLTPRTTVASDGRRVRVALDYFLPLLRSSFAALEWRPSVGPRQRHDGAGRVFRPSRIANAAIRRFKSSPAFAPILDEARRQADEIAAGMSDAFGVQIDAGYIADRIASAVASVLAVSPLMRKWLRRLEPKCVATVVHYGTMNFALCRVAREMGIRVVELQHGTIYPAHAAYNLPARESPYSPDFLLGWGPHWLRQTRNYPLGRAVAAGYPFLDAALKAHPRKPASAAGGPLCVLFISQGTVGAALSDAAVELRSLLPEGDFRVVYKLHPNETRTWRKIYPRLAASKVEVVDNLSRNIYSCIAEADAIAGVYSTAMIEGFTWGVRAFVFRGMPGADTMAAFCESGAAEWVDDAAELARLARRVEGNAPYQRRVEGKAPYQAFSPSEFWTPDAARNVAAALESIADGKDPE